MKHYTSSYLLDPQHPVTINLVGCGGTGSQVLTNLARMDYALRGLGHPGFMVKCFDPDTISESNIGRQLFSPAEIHMHKSTVLVTKINRFFGLNWQSHPTIFNETSELSNITITCVDTASARIKVSEIISEKSDRYPYKQPFYWIDFGNTQKTGQVVIGSLAPIVQPNGDYTNGPPSYLKTIIDLFPDIEKHDKEEIQGPSCSLADALSKQDLFVNSALATLGCDLLWKMFREGGIEYHGLFMNLQTMKVNPIPVGGL